jgi:hypothetical protein
MAETPYWDIIMARLRGFRDITDASTLKSLYSRPSYVKKHLLNHQMLVTYRTHVIKKIKDPLRKALTTGKTFSQLVKVLEIITKRFPDPTNSNTELTNTHNLLKIEKRFFELENNPGRDKMFKSGFKLYEAEYEHDTYYRFRDDWLLEQKIIMVLTGEWKSRPENWPHKKWWRESNPHGGKYTIISALRKHRKEIIELLGEDWQCLSDGKYEDIVRGKSKEKVKV